jgi:hypothetical protein
MAKTKQGLCIAALVATLAAPVARAEETADFAALFEALLGQWEALWQADEVPPANATTPPAPEQAMPGDQSELGPTVPIGG